VTSVDAQAPIGHAFLSYASADSAAVDKLQRALEDAGIRVWRNTKDLWPGEDWRLKIRQAITEDTLVFLACFSAASLGSGGHHWEELNLALDEMRQRRPDVPWLIPIRLEDVELPALELGGGRTLLSLTVVDLFGKRADEATGRLVTLVLRLLNRPRTSRPVVRRQQHRWLTLTLLVAAIALSVAVPPRVPTAEAQRKLIVRLLALDHLGAKVETAQLRPDGGLSTVVIATPIDAVLRHDPVAHGRLVIYDPDTSGRLVPVFTFDPIAVKKTNAGPVPDNAYPESFTFDSIEYHDVNAIAGDEILGALTEVGLDRNLFPRPFVVAWNSEDDNYDIQALLSPESTRVPTMEGTVARPAGAPHDYARGLYDHVYLSPISIRNESKPHQVLQTFATQDFILMPGKPNPATPYFPARLVLRAAYAASGRSANTLDQVQVIDWVVIIDRNGKDVRAYAMKRPGLVDARGYNSRLKELLTELQ
jgi:hypothetical protein